MAEIWLYIAEESSDLTATRFLKKLQATCEGLLAFPLAHPERRQLAAGLRVVFQGPYAIYYRSTVSAVTIIRVLHGARDLNAIIDQEGFDA